MAEKAKTLLLENELTLGDCVALGQTMNTAGFQVLARIYEAVVASAKEHTLKLDPEDANYKDKLAVRTQRERNFNECISYARVCAIAHVSRVKAQREAEDREASEAVANRFGIFPAEKGVEIDAITKTFGIHASRPPKKVTK